eukprot:scaffold84740_cov75-Phaeocystis_antarctica.AAC.8
MRSPLARTTLNARARALGVSQELRGQPPFPGLSPRLVRPRRLVEFHPMAAVHSLFSVLLPVYPVHEGATS